LVIRRFETVKILKAFKERIAEISLHLQSLMTPRFLPTVQDAVEKKDKQLLMKVCNEARVPESYLSTIVSILLSVSPNQKWPAVL
jgi:hypothetical protein